MNVVERFLEQAKKRPLLALGALALVPCLSYIWNSIQTLPTESAAVDAQLCELSESSETDALAATMDQAASCLDLLLDADATCHEWMFSEVTGDLESHELLERQQWLMQNRSDFVQCSGQLSGSVFPSGEFTEALQLLAADVGDGVRILDDCEEMSNRLDGGQLTIQSLGDYSARISAHHATILQATTRYRTLIGLLERWQSQYESRVTIARGNCKSHKNRIFLLKVAVSYIAFFFIYAFWLFLGSATRKPTDGELT